MLVNRPLLLALALAPHASTSLATEQQVAILACGQGNL